MDASTINTKRGSWLGVEYEGQELKPYKQGQLDRFCGIYALVNAIHLASRGVITQEQNIDRIFQTLISMALELEKSDKLRFRGLNNDDLEQLATTLLYGLNLNDYRLRIRDPFTALLKKGERTIAKKKLIKRAAKDHRAALIAHIDNELLSHWSVVKSIEGERVELFDSGIVQSVSLNHVTPWRLVADRTDHIRAVRDS